MAAKKTRKPRLMEPKAVNTLFERFSKAEPHPETELHFTSPYTLLVAVVLSAQATDVGVNKATPALFKAADTPEKMVKLGLEKVRHHIRTIGLFNAKAANVIALSQKLIDEFDSKVPETLEELQSLPGVGRKTANVILNCAFGKPTIAVDTHVFRVSNRLGLVSAKNVEETERQLEKNIPEKWKMHAHHWLILHGRYRCKARKPQCNACMVKDLCLFDAKE